MAHNVETMAYAGETPWHGLGVPVPADLTPAQMQEAAGLDWTVGKSDLFYNVGDRQVRAGKKQALIRESDGRMLDVVSEDWTPVQNEQAFEFFNDFCAAGEMEMHTAGSLQNGKLVWALGKTKDAFELFNGDVTEQYVLFTNPHKFGAAIDIRLTNVRVVCNNTLNYALAGESDKVVRLSHRQEFNPDEVKAMMGVAKEKLAQYKEMSAFLGSKQASMEGLINYFNEVFPKTYKANEVDTSIIQPHSKAATRALEVIDTQPGAEFARGSWWQAFNAVTYLTDHELGKSQNSRLTSAWYGVNRQRKIAALNKAVEYAEAA
jgi:phage/plasmid-like protein (TIGR03299 family)